LPPFAFPEADTNALADVELALKVLLATAPFPARPVPLLTNPPVPA
jgi:hypothetical protein